MDATTIIVAIFGSLGGLAAVITAIREVREYLDKRKGNTIEAKLEEELKPLLVLIEAQNTKIDDLKAQGEKRDREIKEIRLDTTRTQLYQKMDNDTHNHDTIFKIAERYFLDLGGDWTATVDFQAWADREHIKIPPAIAQAMANNDRKIARSK